MADRDLPPAHAVRQLLDYCPQSGELTWKARGSEWFRGNQAEKYAAIWNKNNAGRVAFWRDRLGYKGGSLMGCRVTAQRVVWAWHNGEWPSGVVDHISGDTTDNRIENLRVVDTQGNARNQKLFANNSSGVTGVYWTPRVSMWRATIRVNGKLRHIGYFKDKGQAAAARRGAQRAYGFHENHGRAA